VGKGSRDLLLKFWDPLHISGTVGARNFIFDTQIDHQGRQRKKCKIRSKGATTFLYFGTPPYLGKGWS